MCIQLWFLVWQQISIKNSIPPPNLLKHMKHLLTISLLPILMSSPSALYILKFSLLHLNLLHRSNLTLLEPISQPQEAASAEPAAAKDSADATESGNNNIIDSSGNGNGSTGNPKSGDNGSASNSTTSDKGAPIDTTAAPAQVAKPNAHLQSSPKWGNISKLLDSY